MLLSKTAKVKWNGSNRKWYEQFGYVFTKNGDEFEVTVAELSNSSRSLVLVKCDCGNCQEKWIPWNKYKRSSSNKYYYNNCITKLTKSFEQWCIENNRYDILDRWDYELNKLSPSEITCGSNRKCWFKCDKHIEHPSELKYINHYYSGKIKFITCNSCNSFAQWGITNVDSDFLNKYWSDKNTLNPWGISRCSTNKVWIKCQEKDYHGDYDIQCYHFVKGVRCGYCYNMKLHPKDSLGQYIIDNFGQEFLNKIWSDKNVKTAFEYRQHSDKKAWWKCLDNKHEDYCRSVYNQIRDEFRCGECSQERNESILQEKVRLYLEETNYMISHENKCTIVPKSPKTKLNLPFDNEIKELKLIIEVNGVQHYKISSWHKKLAENRGTTPKYELHMIKVRDRYKRIKAIQQGYYYLDIPYWTDNKKEDWKTLIDNKINKILMENKLSSMIN